MQPRCQQCAAAARLLSPSPAARTRCLSTAPPSAFRTLQPYTSPHGRRLFLESAAAAALHAYLPLAAQRSAQPSAALQGASTLTVVLNAMGVDPGRVWKWPWRWYAEAMLLPAAAAAAAAAAQQSPPPCASLEDMAALARSQGLGARVVRAAGASGGGGGGAAPPALAALRAAALATSTTPVARHFAVVAYSREVVAGAGGGAGGGAAPHFSLVAGFHAEEDAVLLMDVHPARAVPSWVSVGALHGAMLQLRGAGGGGGGFVLLSAPDEPPPPLA